ncbi:F-actin-capping protein subunit alpha-like protein [Baffinella frigidus]|nr:F-actin-capping protein subunit alpha-like protein [Cryptophyta sp. CCMP2293]
MADGEAMSSEDKIKVAAGFIMKAPPGEVKDVVKDARVLVAEDALFDARLPAILKV